MALQFVAEKAFHFTNGDNHDKIWAAAVAKDATQGVYMAVWGKRIGAFGSSDKYQSQQKQGSVGAMESFYQSKVREKEGKGYVQVPFNDPTLGRIPSFSGGNVVMVGPDGGQQITAAGLLKQIESLIGRLVRKSASGVEMSGLIMEFQQVKVKTEIFVEFGGASGDEKVKIATLTGQLQSRLQVALVG
jgi:hypothetical protein